MIEDENFFLKSLRRLFSANPSISTKSCEPSFFKIPGHVDCVWWGGSVIRLGDLLVFGRLFKAFCKGLLAQIAHILANFWNVVKSVYCLSESIFGKLLIDIGQRFPKHSGHPGVESRQTDGQAISKLDQIFGRPFDSIEPINQYRTSQKNSIIAFRMADWESNYDWTIA